MLVVSPQIPHTLSHFKSHGETASVMHGKQVLWVLAYTALILGQILPISSFCGSAGRAHKILVMRGVPSNSACFSFYLFEIIQSILTCTSKSLSTYQVHREDTIFSRYLNSILLHSR